MTIVELLSVGAFVYTWKSFTGTSLSHGENHPSAQRTHKKLSQWVLYYIHGFSQPNLAIFTTIKTKTMTLLARPSTGTSHESPSFIGPDLVWSATADDKATDCRTENISANQLTNSCSHLYPPQYAAFWSFYRKNTSMNFEKEKCSQSH